MISHDKQLRELREENRRLKRQLRRLMSDDGRSPGAPARNDDSPGVDGNRLSEIADCIPGALYRFVRDPDGRFSMNFISGGARELFGADIAELSGDISIDVIHPDDIEEFVASIGESADNLTPWDHEYRVRMPDGSMKWIRGQSVPKERADGAIEWNGILTDITARKTVEKELWLSNRRYESILHDQLDFIVHWKDDGTRTFVNEAYCSYYRLTCEEALGTNFFAHIAEEDRKAVSKRLENLSPDHPVSTDIHRVIRPDGSMGWNEWTDRAIFDDAGTVLEYHSIGRDITERMHTEEALRESEELLRHSNDLLSSVMDNTFMMAVYLDPECNFVWVNRAYADTCGHDPAFFPGKKHFDLYPHEENQAIFQRVLETGEPFFAEAKPFEFPDQPERGVTWWDWSLRPVKNSGGTIIGLVFSLNDVTDKIKAQNKLRVTTRLLDSIRAIQSEYIASEEAEPVFRSLLHTLIQITDSRFGFLDEVLADEKGNRYKINLALSDVSWDEASRELYGKLVKRQLEFRNLDNLSGLPAKTGKLVIANDAVRDPRSGGIPPGHPVIESFMGIPLYFGGELLGVAGVANREGGYDEEMADRLQPFLSSCAALILSVRTKKREQEHAEEIRNTMQLMQSILNASMESAFLIDTKGTILSGNEIFAERLGVSLPEIIGNTIYDLIPPDVAAFRKDKVRDVINTKSVVTFEDSRDGIIFNHNLHPVVNKYGEVESIAIFGADITERKKSENALRESEERYRRIVETSREGIWSMDGNHTTMYVNRHMAELLGYEPDEMIGKKVEYFMFDEDLVDHKENMKRRKAGADQQYERRFIHKNGSEVWTIVSATALKNDQGVFAGSFAMFTDITERKKSEHALRESEERFRALIEATPMSVLLVRNGTHIYGNPSAARLLGFDDPGQIIGRNVLDTIAPEYHDMIKTRMTVIDKGRDNPPLEMELLRADGSRIWSRSTSVSVMLEGKPTAIIVGEDISERRKAEKALRESEEKYRTIFNNASLGIFRSTPEGRFIEVNPALAAILGYDAPEDVIENIYSIADQIYVSSEDRGGIVTEQLASSETRQYRNRYRRKDGSEFIANLYLKTIRDDNDDPLYFEGIIEDITKTIEAEQKLRDSEANLNAIFNNIEDIIVSRDREGRAVKYNDGFRDIVPILFGVEAFEGIRTMDYLPEDARAHWLEVHERILAGETHTEEFEWEIDGEVRYFELTFNPIFSGDEIIGSLEHNRDITERKRDENRLKTSLDEKELLLREIHHRVKNNLQVISSLLRLQRSEITDPDHAKPLTESINRINIISMIHALLYQSENIKGVNASDFINELLDNLGEVFREIRSRVIIATDIGQLSLGLDSAIPIGLILNELVTNALKYAFPDDRPGRIAVHLNRDSDGMVELRVTDDGVGLPASIDPLESKTLGLKIIRGLARQLDSQISYDRTRGTTFTLHFEEMKNP